MPVSDVAKPRPDIVCLLTTDRRRVAVLIRWPIDVTWPIDCTYRRSGVVHALFVRRVCARRVLSSLKVSSPWCPIVQLTVDGHCRPAERPAPAGWYHPLDDNNSSKGLTFLASSFIGIVDHILLTNFFLSRIIFVSSLWMRSSGHMKTFNQDTSSLYFAIALPLIVLSVKIRCRLFEARC